MKILFLVVVVACAFGTTRGNGNLLDSIIRPFFGKSSIISIARWFQSTIKSNDGELKGGCNYFPFLDTFSDPDVKKIAKELNRFMCENGKLLTELSKNVQLLLEVLPKQFPEKERDCSNPDVPADMLIAVYGDNNEAGIRLFDVDGEGNYVMRGNYVETTKRPYFMISNKAQDRIVTIEDNRKDFSNYTVYTKDACTGRFNKSSTYPTVDSAYSMTLDPTEKYLLTTSYYRDDVTLYSLSEAGSLKEVDYFDVSKFAGVGNHHPYKVGFFPKGKEYFAVAYAGLDVVALFTIDPSNITIVPQITVMLDKKSFPVNFVISDDANYMYVLCVKYGEVAVVNFVRDAVTHEVNDYNVTQYLEWGDSGDTINDGRIVLHPEGKFLYSMIRYHKNIGVLGINQVDGKLTLVEKKVIERNGPFDIQITPDGERLLVSYEDVSYVDIFTISATDGSLTWLDTINHVGSARTIIIYK